MCNVTYYPTVLHSQEILRYTQDDMNVILELFFPKRCVGCGIFNAYFCQKCILNIKQADLVCPFCERLSIGGQVHPLCKRKYGLDGLWSLGVYQNPLREAIKQLKYRNVSQLAETLTDIIIEYWAKYPPLFLDQIKQDGGKGWMVVPIPLYWYRQNYRGFNQSSLIGQNLSKKLGLDYCDAIKRIRFTKSQTKLKGKERYQNIRGAFALSPNYQLQTTPYILLIDDVWTTGSTLKECCFCLKKAGAKKVWAITLAR